MKVSVQISCERCGESHGTVDVGPKKLAEQKGPKRMAEFVASLLPMFLRQGIEHDCSMTDARRAGIKKYIKDSRPEITMSAEELAEGMPREIDIDGLLDERTGIEYVGKALRQEGGKYVCLAKVPLHGEDSLCRVEVSIRLKDAP